jgi:hypothetical protein
MFHVEHIVIILMAIQIRHDRQVQENWAEKGAAQGPALFDLAVTIDARDTPFFADFAKGGNHGRIGAGDY